jgi:hypothetical protein
LPLLEAFLYYSRSGSNRENSRQIKSSIHESLSKAGINITPFATAGMGQPHPGPDPVIQFIEQLLENDESGTGTIHDM